MQTDDRCHAVLSFPKLCCFLLAAFFLQASSLHAQTITVKAKDWPLEKVFATVKAQTGYVFLYTDKLLENARPVTVAVTKLPLTEFLDLIFSTQPFKYSIENKTIIVSPKPATVKPSGTQPVNAEQLPVSGVVRGPDGQPLADISVMIKGTSRGTTTKADGSFTLLASKNEMLMISGVEYETIELKIGDKTTFNITLKNKPTNLDDVIIIGYGTTKKGDVTGSVSKAPIENMQKAPVRSFDEALAGRVAGVNVSSVDGQPGSAINITIRGANSITQDNSPLYVIDGFPIESPDNNFLNPADIESLEVLKDASATAIYGSRAANGVIIITTKKGKAGPPVVTFRTSYGIQKDVNRMKLMSPYEFVKYQLEKNPADATNIYLSEGRTLDYYKTVPEIDWQDELFRTAPISNHSLSVSGGNNTTRYYVSGNSFDQDGVIINSAYKRYQGSMSLDQTFNTKLKGGVYINYAYNKQSGISPSTPESNSSTAATLFSVYGYRNFSLGGTNDLSDQLFDQFIDPTIDMRINPVLNQQHLLRENLRKNTIINAYLDYAILPQLKLKITAGINTSTIQNNQFNDTFTVYGNPRTLQGSVNGINGSVIFNESTTWINENTLTYNLKIKKDHQFTLLGGFTQSENKSSRHGSAATNLPNSDHGISGLDQGTPQTVQAYSSSWGLVSFLGRADYKFRNKYLVTLSWRADGSSKFAPDNRWGYFPSGAIAWNFSREKFSKNWRFLSDGKLRASYGLTGNNRVGDFSYLPAMNTAYNPQGYTFGNNTSLGTIPSNIGNASLKWETTEQYNIGTDLSFLNNRLSFTADVYRKTTRDLLLYANIPLSLGYANALRNIGSVRNQGLELSISSVNINTRDFTWKTSFNISFNKSKILKLTENQESMTSAAPFDNYFKTIPAFISEAGNQLGMMYGYIWEGVYQYSDFDVSTTGNYVLKDNVATNGNTRSAIQPGDIKFRDINGDLTVDSKDYAIIGRGLPVHTGGFTNDLTYKNFDLNLFFQWSYGNDIINANRYIFEGNILGRSNLNQFAGYENRWTPENSHSNMPRAGFGGSGPSTPTGTNSRVIEDGSYLRLKTVQLGYNFSPKLLSSIKIKSCRIYVAGQNLVTWTNYSGVDPEVSIFNSVLTPGVDYSAYPRPRTMTIGANITF